MAIIQGITFDAGQTLLEPILPPEETYHRVFQKLGYSVVFEEVKKAFRQAWKARDHGKELQIDRYSRFPEGEKGFWRDFVFEVMDRLNLSNHRESCFEFLYDYFRRPSAWRLFEDAKEVIPRLKQKKLKLAVISNWDSYLETLLKSLRIDVYFDAIIISAKEGIAKPSPLIFQKALKSLTLPPSSVLHVGDSLQDDWLSAKAVGMEALLLVRQGKPPGNYPSIRSLWELLKLL